MELIEDLNKLAKLIGLKRTAFRSNKKKTDRKKVKLCQPVDWLCIGNDSSTRLSNNNNRRCEERRAKMFVAQVEE